ncbi:MAG: GFA family protein [Halioglobus sp.]
MTGTMEISARCECGALTLQIKGEPVVQLVCHCKDCRVFSGMPYIEAAFFQPDGISVRGQASSTTMKGGTGFGKTHYSCASCQTPLYVTVAALNGAAAVMANRLTPFKFEPQVHIWTSEKAHGVTIPEGITQSSGPPPKAIADTMVSKFWGT